MQVQQTTPIQNGHSIELGIATWDNGSGTDRSVRNRYATSTGGFSPRSSSEVPISDLVPMLKFAAQHDELSVAECAEIIQALTTSSQRQIP